ncbi:MAG: BrnT family toxin [Treponema sp.]|nr:BrnT family toxin [Treponema sp.]
MTCIFFPAAYPCSIPYRVWNDNEDQLNIKRRGISFVQAAHIFSDPLRREYYDAAHSEEDDRVIAIGSASGRILFVSFIERAMIWYGLYRPEKPRKEKRISNFLQEPVPKLTRTVGSRFGTGSSANWTPTL